MGDAKGGKPPLDLDATVLVRKDKNDIAHRPLFAPLDLEAGDRVDHYVIESRRGGGGFATVYRARDERDGRAVAIKVLHSYLARTPSIRRRFEREAETIGALAHPNIVRLLGYGEVRDGIPYLAMEWIEGATLAELLRERGPFAIDDALPICAALAAALDAAHRAGVVHRDLNVANVAIDDRTVKLLDFGIAKLLDVEEQASSGFTTAGTKIGTPHYMAPEQVLGKAIDHRVDVYAFGILLFELLTCKRPFDGHDLAEVEEKQLREPAPLASRLAPITPAVDGVIRHAMEKDPAHRPSTVGAVVDELRAAIANPTLAAVVARRRGIAMYLHAGVRHDDVDDAALDELDRTLEHARDRAHAAGLEIATRTSNALLLVGTGVGLGDVEALAREVAASTTHPDVEIALTVHVDDVDVIDEAGRSRYVGGPLLEVATWIRSDAGVHVTPQARR